MDIPLKRKKKVSNPSSKGSSSNKNEAIKKRIKVIAKGGEWKVFMKKYFIYNMAKYTFYNIEAKPLVKESPLIENLKGFERYDGYYLFIDPYFTIDVLDIPHG